MIDVPLGRAGRIDELSPMVRRILAPNPSVMTGPGTNTYLVGRDELAVIDPGPDDPIHLDRVAAAGEGRIRWIIATHTHPDHWPGVAGLKARTGARVLAHSARDGLEIDASLADGDTVDVPDATLTVLHTPGHGQLFDEPAAAITQIIEHRLAREAKIAGALARAGEAVTVDALLGAVYDDVDPGRLPIARGSLWAHLRKLVDDGRATTDGYDDLDGGRWAPRASAPRGDHDG